ncbi:hypothetical protein LIER_25093 [Lithospermum erythrorhizon]|uniref:Uncharacterized protein n=1 Tax=Lithospermum erythrorhizon TaxID=34254 RepID=A0AAV3R7H9_LITER
MPVDGRSAVNILPLQTLKLLHISTDDLQQSRIIIQGFNQGRERTLGKVSLHLVIGESETTSWFHVIDANVTYNILPGRPWIHSSNAVSSTLHQCLKYYKDGMEKTVQADENPFAVEEFHFADAKYYKKNDKSQHEERAKAPQVVTLPLKGFVTPKEGPKVEHETMDPKAYDLFLEDDYDPIKDQAMG